MAHFTDYVLGKRLSGEKREKRRMLFPVRTSNVLGEDHQSQIYFEVPIEKKFRSGRAHTSQE